MIWGFYIVSAILSAIVMVLLLPLVRGQGLKVFLMVLFSGVAIYLYSLLGHPDLLF